ncbi:formamidopyrimidine-DNA glycosylase [Colletotrichum asianum]
MRGASALFAWRVSQGRLTTVLTPPPPHRFHPSGLTNYQDVEEPILKGVLGSSVERIMMAHPEVAGAESFVYEAWPSDRYATWVASFGEFPDKAWRLVGRTRARTIWQAVPRPMPSGPLFQSMTEHNCQGTSKQHQGQHQGQLQEQAQAKDKKPEVNQSPGPGVLAFMVFIEIFLHVVLPFTVFLETITTQFRYECQNPEPQTEMKLGSSTPSKNTEPRKSSLGRTDASANQCLVANKATGIFGGGVPPRRLKKKQRQKLSHPQESTPQHIITQSSTVIVCRSLGGWDPESLKKAFRNRAQRVTLSSI